MSALQEWNHYFRRLAIPALLFLCLDFLYRLSEMTLIRDEALSFSLIEIVLLALAAALAVPPALLQKTTGWSLLRKTTAVFAFWLSLFIFLTYFKKWLFTFPSVVTSLDIRRYHVFAVSVVPLLLFAFLARRRSPLTLRVPSALAHAERRMSRLIAITAVLSASALAYSALTAGAREAASNGQAGRKPPNVVLILFDTLSAKHLGLYGGDARTETFDGLARKGYSFANARANVTCTGPNISSLLSGRSPLASHVLGYHPVPGESASKNLISFLEKKNYETESVVDVHYASPYFHGFSPPSRGESFFYADPFSDRANRLLSSWGRKLGFAIKFRLPTLWQLPDRPFDALFADLLDRVKKASAQPKPFFLYSHIYFPNHIKYDPDFDRTALTYPGPYDKKDQPFVDRARVFYDRGVQDLDAELGRHIQKLNDVGLLKDTILIVTADHGESFGRGFWGHGDDLSEASIRVPLFILAPSGEIKTVEGPVQTCDIAPTVLQLLKFEKPEWMDCQSGLDESAPRHAAVTFNSLLSVPLRTKIPFPGFSLGMSVAFFQDGLKLIQGPEGFELFDLAKDPEETRDLSSESGEEAAELKKNLSMSLSLNPS